MKFILNESLSEKDIRKAMSKVYQAYEKYNENDGNQNCMMCAWALEMQLRGNRSFLPRPVFSPRDVVFTEIAGGWLIVKKPRKIGIKNKLSVIQEVEEADEGARFYCHVNWQDSTGGHEFLVLNIEGKAYVADAQANVLNPVEDDHTYFEDINWDNSLLVRLDNKEIDDNILKYNDDKYILEWDDELDMAFLKAQEDEITEAVSTGTKKLDLISIQNFIESCELAKTTPPKEGGCYITPSGLYINTSDIKLKNKKLAREFDGEHEGLVYYLQEKGIISQYTDLLSAEAVPYLLNYIRCRNDGVDFTYLRLPPEVLTPKQLRALESWLETCPYDYNLEAEDASGIQFQSYDLQEYSIEDIMRKVRRYYITKKLEEAVTERLEKITYKPVEDVEQFKAYADQILGGDGNMSATDIQSSIKEIYIDNELVGYIGFSEYEEDDVKMLGIGNFMTIQQGKGHGTKIINDIVETKKNEYDLIYCFVDADNAGAIRLYKKLGTVYDEDGPNDNGQYYVTFYDNGKFDLDEDFDPPYNEEQIKANYGDETYQRLIDDPAHAWRMKTGLELIHKEPSKKELERIWANWQEMTDEQKAESDKKSIELFGKTNEENYNELIKLYGVN